VSIATSVESYLTREGITYDTLHHAPTKDSMHSAQAAHIPGDKLAKCVLLEDDNGFLMAVVPATHKVDLGALHRALNRNLGLATDRALIELFRDCEPGAVPPLGPAYGIDTIMDERLADAPDIYFEGGDHQALIHLDGTEFLKLMSKVPRARISHHV
jgi:Ala-tRNA(Pro) deacylase